MPDDRDRAARHLRHETERLDAIVVSGQDGEERAIEALKSGRLGGFALDVQYREPLPDDDELLRLPNVILTPRMAGSPRQNGLNDFEELITTLAREISS